MKFNIEDSFVGMLIGFLIVGVALTSIGLFNEAVRELINFKQWVFFSLIGGLFGVLLVNSFSKQIANSQQDKNGGEPRCHE